MAFSLLATGPAVVLNEALAKSIPELCRMYLRFFPTDVVLFHDKGALDSAGVSKKMEAAVTRVRQCTQNRAKLVLSELVGKHAEGSAEAEILKTKRDKRLPKTCTWFGPDYHRMQVWRFVSQPSSPVLAGESRAELANRVMPDSDAPISLEDYEAAVRHAPAYDYYVQLDHNLYFLKPPQCDIARLMVDSRAIVASVGVGDSSTKCKVGIRTDLMKWMEAHGMDPPLGQGSSMSDGMVGGFVVLKATFFSHPAVQAVLRRVFGTIVASGRDTDMGALKMPVDTLAGPGAFHLIGGFGPFKHRTDTVFGRTGKGWAAIQTVEKDAFCYLQKEIKTAEARRTADGAVETQAPADAADGDTAGSGTGPPGHQATAGTVSAAESAAPAPDNTTAAAAETYIPTPPDLRIRMAARYWQEVGASRRGLVETIKGCLHTKKGKCKWVEPEAAME